MIRNRLTGLDPEAPVATRTAMVIRDPVPTPCGCGATWTMECEEVVWCHCLVAVPVWRWAVWHRRGCEVAGC